MWSVFFVFLSYLDRNFVRGDFLSRALDAEKQSKEMFSMLNGTFCAKMSTVGENFLYQVSDGAEVVRSVVAPSGRLVNCSVTVNQIQVKSFMHECRLGLKERRAGRRLDAHFTRMSEAKLMCRELKETSGRSGSVKRDESGESSPKSEVLKRSKRGFTYPGTLWCGAGNMADNYDQLGNFAQTDSCCRTHDHCPHVIHAFSSKYGHTNFKWHSICHCDCDNALRACLRKVNDTSSRVVGQAFFNVIGVPCFELVYEEQCAERHWYGVCKRYEKLPVAVLKEAVPYDFGGIAIIDELTLAPPKQKDSEKSREGEKPEGTTQSTISGPEEPSLTNVVTAAEDFIKVLATVSTSQSSAADSDKDETQSSEKKKRKNTGKKKKTTKKQKGKGKGKKRKQNAEAGVKIDDSAVVPPAGSKTEEVSVLSNFISDSLKHDTSSRDTSRVGDNEYELRGKDEASNEVMKDEPVMDEATVSTTTVQKKPDTDLLPEEISPASTSTTTVTPHKAKIRKLRKGRGKKKNKKCPHPCYEELVTNAPDNRRGISVPTIININPTVQPEQQSFRGDTERRPLVSAATAPIVIPSVKRNRSKERGDRDRSKKRRKINSASPIVTAAHKNSSVDNLKAIPLYGTPTLTPVPTTERQVSHRPDNYRGKTLNYVTARNSSFSVMKRQRSKERGLRRRKTILPLSSENPLYLNNPGNVLPFLTTPDTSSALNSPETTTAVNRPTEKLETHSEWRLFTTAAPTINTKRHRQRHQRKLRKKAVPAASRDRASVLKQTEFTPMTFTTAPPKVTTAEELSPQRFEKPCTTTSASPFMSPIQLSIERARAQFTRKKRRKAALSNRQQ